MYWKRPAGVLLLVLGSAEAACSWASPCLHSNGAACSVLVSTDKGIIPNIVPLSQCDTARAAPTGRYLCCDPGTTRQSHAPPFGDSRRRRTYYERRRRTSYVAPTPKPTPSPTKAPTP